MAGTMESLGLKHNANYEDMGVEVKHEDKGWFPLIRTSLKMAFYLDSEGKERRMSMAKLAEARGVDGVEPAVKEDEAPEVDPLDKGLYSNTNYEGQGVEVLHSSDEAWYPLVRTSNQVLYIDKGGENPNRMTLKMLGGVRGIEGEAAEEASEEDASSESADGAFSEEYLDTEFAQAMQEEVAEESAA